MHRPKKIAFAHLSMLVSEPAIELAHMIKELAPGDLNYTWFVSGGSEAVESAVKLARQYFIERDGENSSKYVIIGRWNSFHGNTLGALAIGGRYFEKKALCSDAKGIPPYIYSLLLSLLL